MSSPDAAPDKLKGDSLSWALTHIQRYGDTDLFPIPFEYEVIKAYWTPLLASLSDCDLGNHELSPAIKLMLPKSNTGYRAITQLDPLDTILLTAAVYEATPLIEAYRRPKADRVDCAYRADIKPDGQLFSPDSGWKDFHAKAAELVATNSFKFILCADIADYYTQASHHRIQNALSKAGVEHGRSKNIEEFLSRLNSLHHSKGIPVGPSSGILLAEACLSDVDAALARKGYVHTRYVDDFRIFCKTAEEAEFALHDLSEYLFTAHRLSLQQGKTRIFDVPTFTKEEMLDPEELEIEAKRERIQDFLKDAKLSDYDTDDAWPIDEDDEAQIDLQSLRDLFLRAVQNDRLSVGLAKYVLRRAAKLRTRVFLDDLLKKMPLMIPVIRDTVTFLIKASGPKDMERVGHALRALADESHYKFLPIVRLWIIEAFCRKPAFASAADALRIAEGSHPLLRDRMAALVAKAYNVSDWVREKKETWMNYGPWAHRAILYASSVLPADERIHWLKSAHGHPLLLTRAVAKVS
ncbi:MAG TPA: RNA-directed DNA polymerase [Opitutus sp.]|nr:RNA-directed DNA polymerase [Opitutus sp.]